MKRRRPERGPVLLFTGDGKGKTSAAMGTALRLAGRGKRVLVLQFAKPPGVSGEQRALKKLAPKVRVKALGKGWLDLSARPRRARDLDDIARQWDRARGAHIGRALGRGRARRAEFRRLRGVPAGE